jgi:tRNA nucleotidyltransferase (CCA-adding enzyme)
MKVYLVGGAVRDALLGRPVGERDYVVTGATAQQLLDAGFTPVGRDFPVFLHPKTKSEYALARRERKTGPGYRGFITEFSPDITLEEDLLRRDLTINAIAQAQDGSLIDPYGGRADLEARVLRHVSEAFVEDPVRILRVARFAARFAPLGFKVHADTLALMRRMVAAKEVDALVAERVWQETDRALAEDSPDVYLRVLRECGALEVILPEVARLFGVPQPEQWHPEVDTGEHVLLCLRQAARLGMPTVVRFALLAHDLGKALTPREAWPKHHGHEQKGLPVVEQLCDRLRVPSAYRDLARLACLHHGNVHRAFELRTDTILELLERCDAFRRPARFAELLLACQADAQGRTGREHLDYPQRGYLAQAHAAASAAALDDTERASLSGPQIAAVLRAKRRAAIDALREATRAARPATGG